MGDRRSLPDQHDGLLARWSRRKVDVRQGLPLSEPVPPAPERKPTIMKSDVGAAADAAIEPDAAPLPSLADVQALTAESDFAPFMARGVSPGVRNAAMKKLFTDPHYNVMDGLDIYIDDYTKTTPLTLAMLKSMTSAKFLGLLDNEEGEGDSGQLEQAAASPNADARLPEGREDADAPDHLRMADSSDQGEHAGDEADDPDRHPPPVAES